MCGGGGGEGANDDQCFKIMTNLLFNVSYYLVASLLEFLEFY